MERRPSEDPPLYERPGTPQRWKRYRIFPEVVYVGQLSNESEILGKTWSVNEVSMPSKFPLQKTIVQLYLFVVIFRLIFHEGFSRASG